jgi:hypothetical protein
MGYFSSDVKRVVDLDSVNFGADEDVHVTVEQND